MIFQLCKYFSTSFSWNEEWSEEDFELVDKISEYALLNDFYLYLRNIVLLLPQGLLLFVFLANGHIPNVASAQPNFAKIDLEYDNVVLFYYSNTEKSNVDVQNVVSTLILHCQTSRRHISLKKTLKQRWNYC